jgi:hypothetical protein
MVPVATSLQCKPVTFAPSERRRAACRVHSSCSRFSVGGESQLLPSGRDRGQGGRIRHRQRGQVTGRSGQLGVT